MTVGNFDQLVKSGKQIIQRDPFSVMYLGMNQEVPILQNLKVRQAIEMGLDKDTLIRRFFIDNIANKTLRCLKQNLEAEELEVRNSKLEESSNS